MKKKIIIASATVLFAAAAVFNINLLQGNGMSEVSLDDIAVMAQAQAETGQIGPAGSNWKWTTFQCSKTVVVGFDFILKIEKTTTTYYTAEGCGFGSGWCLASAGC